MGNRSPRIFSCAEKSQLQIPSLHACASWQESMSLINAPICPGIRTWQQPDDALGSLKNQGENHVN
jgi:hypothetical protein